jgi:glycosyltransferase involved in cell wall biosynthesis
MHLRRPDEEPVCESVRERCDFVEAVTVPDPAHPARRFRRWVKLLATRRPVQVTDFSSALYAARLCEVVEQWKPDVIQVELEAMGQYLPLLTDRPGRRLLVVVEPAAKTAEEIWRASRGFERLLRRLDRKAWHAFERRIAGRADAVVVLTERDGEVASPLAAGAPVYTIPLGTDLPATPLDPLGVAPPGILFVGGFGHRPNVEAALVLATRIFPTVSTRRPEARLYLVGDKPPPKIRALAGKNVVVTGRVRDVREYVSRAAVVAAPLKLGGGMRLKVLEALAAGKALVATPRAVEGLAIRHGEHALIADSDDAFAEALLRLLDNPRERRELAEGAREWAMAHLDLARMAAAYERLYDELLASPSPRP